MVKPTRKSTSRKSRARKPTRKSTSRKSRARKPTRKSRVKKSVEISSREDKVEFKKKQSEQIPSDCNDKKKAFEYMKSKGIKSKIAMFYILCSCSSTTFKNISLKIATNRWIEEKEILKKIHKKASNINGLTNEEKSTYFAIGVLYYLQFKKLFWEEKELNIDYLKQQNQSCPYADDAKNFILSLVKTNKCLCLCYTNYVLAAAQEYDYNLIRACTLNGHIKIAIVYNDKYQYSNYNKNNIKYTSPSFNNDIQIYPKIENLNNKNSILYSTLDSGFRNNNYIIIDYNSSTVNNKIFFDKLITNNTLKYRLYISSIKNLNCQNGISFHSTIWDFTYLLNYSGTRKSIKKEKYDNDIDRIQVIYDIDLGNFKKIIEDFKILTRIEQVEHINVIKGIKQNFQLLIDICNKISNEKKDKPNFHNIQDFIVYAYYFAGWYTIV